MNIHEYQAKQILEKYGIPVPEYYVVSSIAEVEELLNTTGWQSAVLKVQVHAGGRGKAGGVKIAHQPKDILQAAHDLLGKKIINEQTGPEGMVAHQLLISAPLQIVHEYYVGMTISRERAQSVLIASPVGGVDIEVVAEKQPDKVFILPLPADGMLRSYQLIRLAKFMKWHGETARQGMLLVAALAKAFTDADASLLEINPLVRTEGGNLFALDAKLVIDDNALYRQPVLKALFDPTQVSKGEACAQQHELAYVALEGDIG
jgi:succinyl-CoA synthetase beta subunit